jgi:hypothetical protein
MPFTLSHTLAIYPFRKFCGKYLSFSGLFMGSMVPDFEFFFRVTLYAVWSHTFWGVFLFDLPLALLLLLIFHQWTKKATLIRIMGGKSTGINAYCLRTLKIDIYLTINYIAILTNS